ncbi:ABC transporter permease [Azospirillum halopraeferens]|uniref:ABC transporter permease n=1 Tax=Azospirillum halopraeferens TaxID=34010 RepID=UPI000415E181|nr:ABC transporter permease [Azospirillum halopraeferens]
MRALTRKLLRDVRRIRGQALAIAVVIACGVATVVLSFGALRSLEETRIAYYERYRFADVFATLTRAPEPVADRVRALPGVARAETRIVRSATLAMPGVAEPVSARLVSLPERGEPLLNAPAVRAGRLPDPLHPDEALVGEAFAEAHGLSPGDTVEATVNGRRRTLRVVGIALSPEYVYSLGPGQLMPDNRRFGVFWMGRRALAAAFDLEGAFNDLSVALMRGVPEADVIARIDSLLAPYGGIGAYGRRDQMSDAFLTGELDQLRMTGTMIPPVFLAVAAFLLHMVVSRLIDTEREQIGLLKAFGYGDMAIGLHYLKLVLALTLPGVALGWALGSWLGYGLTHLYAEFYRFPVLLYRPDPTVYASSALVAVAATVAGTLLAVRRAVALAPAVAMAPAAPVLYRRGGVLGAALGRVVDGPSRMVVRHIVRRPLRAAMTTLGIAASVALLIGSTFGLDAVELMVETQYYRANRQDATLVFTDVRHDGVLHEVARLPGVRSAEGFRSVAVRLRAGHYVRRAEIRGLDGDAALSRVLDTELRPVTLPPAGLVLSSKLAALLRVGAGDTVTVEVLEGRRRTVTAPVTLVVEEFIGAGAAMDRAALNRLLGEGGVVSGAHLMLDPLHAGDLFRRLNEMPGVAGITLRAAAVGGFRDTIAESMGMMLTLYMLFGGAIAFGVLYNSARITLSERGRELASLRVLGFTRGEVAYILLGELAVLTAAALPLGCLLGYGLAAGFAAGLDTELFRVPLEVEDRTYGRAVLVVLAAAVTAGAAVGRRVVRLDLIAVLKTRE